MTHTILHVLTLSWISSFIFYHAFSHPLCLSHHGFLQSLVLIRLLSTRMLAHAFLLFWKLNFPSLDYWTFLLLQMWIKLSLPQGNTVALIRSSGLFICCHQFSSFQPLSRVWLFATPWTAVYQASLSITSSRILLKLISIKLVMPSNYLILCRPLLFLPSIFPSIRVFSNESALHIRWPKYWSFSYNISPSNEHSRVISFRMDSLDLLAVQETLKSLLQHHSSKASILQHSAFFTVQLSHPYMTTGKTIALTRHTFVGKVMSLLYNWS